VPGGMSFLRTSGSCHELIHWCVDSAGRISKTEKVGIKASDLRNVHWATTSTFVGWEVQGLWTHADHKPVIRSVASSNHSVATSTAHEEEGDPILQKKFLATGDARGNVHLMRYPALGKVDMELSGGHVGPVSEVRFWHNDKLLLSAGKSDGCVMVWKVHHHHHHHHHHHQEDAAHGDGGAVDAAQDEVASDSSSSGSGSSSD
jgi:WD40 repeat protein